MAPCVDGANTEHLCGLDIRRASEGGGCLEEVPCQGGQRSLCGLRGDPVFVGEAVFRDILLIPFEDIS